ncbi:MAG: hypothetical protein LKCHEGNO_03373 [Burkholderiaceae bacterium]|nr:hypothetical protein [Burkholderiaceae bacterium]
MVDFAARERLLDHRTGLRREAQQPGPGRGQARRAGGRLQRGQTHAALRIDLAAHHQQLLRRGCRLGLLASGVGVGGAVRRRQVHLHQPVVVVGEPVAAAVAHHVVRAARRGVDEAVGDRVVAPDEAVAGAHRRVGIRVGGVGARRVAARRVAQVQVVPDLVHHRLAHRGGAAGQVEADRGIARPVADPGNARTALGHEAVVQRARRRVLEELKIVEFAEDATERRAPFVGRGGQRRDLLRHHRRVVDAGHLRRRQPRAQEVLGIAHHLTDRAADLHRHRHHAQRHAAADARRDARGVGRRRRERRRHGDARAHELRGDRRPVAVGEARVRRHRAGQIAGGRVQRQFGQQRACGVDDTHPALRLGRRLRRRDDIDLDQRRPVAREHQLGVAAGEQQRLRKGNAGDRVVARGRRWRRRRRGVGRRTGCRAGRSRARRRW